MPLDVQKTLLFFTYFEFLLLIGLLDSRRSTWLYEVVCERRIDLYVSLLLSFQCAHFHNVTGATHGKCLRAYHLILSYRSGLLGLLLLLLTLDERG